MLGTRSKTTVLIAFDPEIKNFFQKLKTEASRPKKQLFEEASSSSSSTKASKIDNEGTTKVEQIMAELAINQGTNLS